ncbi:MAG: hypothetical protein NVS9B1_25400 [Candidatus Dormibacteraceae bacterium]
MRAGTMALVLLLIAACGQPAPAASASPSPRATSAGASPSPAPSPAPSPNPVPAGLPAGVLADTHDGRNYTITLVSPEGKILASVPALLRPANACGSQALGAITPFPSLSTTNSRVYYLDGPDSVRFLGTDGSKGQVARVGGSATISAAFSVSPDDRRIAVSLTDYTSNPVTVKLFVENLDGTGYKEIFTDSSPSGRTIWPVGWYGGRLVLAAFSSTCTQGGGPGVGKPQTYHVVDPDTAARVATLGGPAGYMTDLSAAGAVQVVDGAIRLYTFNSTVARSFATTDPVFTAVAAPDSQRIAYCCDTQNRYVLTEGAGSSTFAAPSGDAGWLDSTHLLLGGTGQTQASIRTVGGQVTPVAAQGSFAGRLPGGLDPGRGT